MIAYDVDMTLAGFDLVFRLYVSRRLSSEEFAKRSENQSV